MSVLVGKPAPDFTAAAVLNGNEIVDAFTLSTEIKDSYAVVFFYPLDFTFVCPTEMHAFQEKLSAFEERGVKIIAVSVDSQFSHFNWLTTPKSKGGIEGVTYPIVADLNKTITRDYDVEVEGAGIAYRGAFVIDKNGVVRSQVVNDLPLGRNIDELIRLIDALQFTEEHGEVCPANWEKGDKSMKATQDGLTEYFG
ncbi:MAG: peroxiredoxin [Fibrobacterales bacterium]